MDALFLKGLILGFSIAAPVGPIGILCIRRTLAGGMARGFISGLGTATADAAYGLIAALGLTAVATLLVEHQLYIRLAGGLFLCYLGYTTFRAKPAGIEVGTNGDGLGADYASALLLTLTNPLTILAFAAVFAGLGLGGSGYAEASIVVFGVFVGSLLWWLILSGTVGLLRARFDLERQSWVNRLSGLVIFAFGLGCLLSLV